MNKKRIAICFFGQMRLFEGINKYFSAWNENSNDYAYDFFMSSWDDFDTDRITIDFVDKAFHNEEQITSTWEAGHTQKAAFHIKSVLDLKQKVNDLSKSTDSLQKSLKNLADNIQQKGLSAVGATKKDLKKPVPIITDNPHTGEYRTK